MSRGLKDGLLFLAISALTLVASPSFGVLSPLARLPDSASIERSALASEHSQFDASQHSFAAPEHVLVLVSRDGTVQFLWCGNDPANGVDELGLMEEAQIVKARLQQSEEYWSAVLDAFALTQEWEAQRAGLARTITQENAALQGMSWWRRNISRPESFTQAFENYRTAERHYESDMERIKQRLESVTTSIRKQLMRDVGVNDAMVFLVEDMKGFGAIKVNEAWRWKEDIFGGRFESDLERHLLGASGSLEVLLNSMIVAPAGQSGKAAFQAAFRKSFAAKTAGSGPAKGFLEVSDAFKSSKAVQHFGSANPTDFIFDPKSQRFIMGRGPHGHDSILQAGRISPHDSIVGGRISRQNGRLVTDEWSGHYGQNWTPEIRQQFQNFMQQHGVSVNHTHWGQ